MKAETSKSTAMAAEVKDVKPLRSTESKKSSSSSSKKKKTMAGQEEEKLPEKLLNGNSLPALEQTKVFLNAYQMDMSKAADHVFKFELKFIKTVVKKQRDGTEASEEKDISRGPRNDVAMQQKRRCLYQCYVVMLQSNANIFGNDPKFYCYDCGINFYSIKDLGVPVTQKLTFQIDPELLQGEARVYLGGRVEGIRAELTSVQTIFPRGHDPEDHSVSQFLDILSNQEITRRNNYLFFPSKIFERESNIALERDPRILKDGMQKNVRYVGDDEKSAVPILQIDPKKSAFFAESTVVDFLNAFLPGNAPLERRIQDNFRLANKQIKGLVVITTHMNHNRTFPLYGLSQESTREKQFEMQGTGPVTVEQYFQQYTLRLVNSRLQCAIEKKPGRQGQASESFYPLEVLKIMPGQRVSIDKQTPQLTEQMIRRCQVLPKDFVGNNHHARDQAIIMNSNPHFNSHNVRVSTELTQADASVLYPPAIHYSQDGRDRDEILDQRAGINWKLGRHRFLNPAQAPRVWVAIIFQGGVPGNGCMRFLQALVNCANQRGVQLGEPNQYDDLPNTNLGLIRERFRVYKENNVNYVMFFTREKLDPVHHTMKQMEVEYPGIVTQHLCAQTMNKAIGDRGAFMVLDNLLLKFNLKLGGINFGLSTSGAFAQNMRGSSASRDIMKDQWLEPGRMFIGLDMSHASPQSLYERQSDIPVSEPTVVGCAYTVGHPVMMRGTYWYQESRVTHIQTEQLSAQLQVALKNYRENIKSFPKHIFVFRGGVSEGEYQTVLAQEKAAFELAFQALSREGLKKPQLTIIIVQRQSNYRIVPTRINTQGKPFEQNVKPGTCIDKRVMHPTATEFLMVGHKTIQGTAHPIRCTVVYDTEPRVPLEEVENISYALCFAHGIVLSPVSVPAPQYSASDLAKRGRNNWKVCKEDEEDRGSQASGRFQLQQGQEAQHFFLDMSQRMEPRATTKFWA